MASTDDPFAGYAGAEPEQQSAVAPAASLPQRGDDPFSGYSVPPSVSAKMKAVGTDTPPEEAGSTFSQSVQTNTPPDVIKADPASFRKSQNDKAAAAAIDSDSDIAHYVNTVPDAAAISSGDWVALSNIAQHAAQAIPQLWNDFADKYITGPTVDYFKAGTESIKEGIRQATDIDDNFRDNSLIKLNPLKGIGNIAAGTIDILMASSGGAVAMEGYLNVMQKLGIPREDAARALLALAPRLPGRAVTSLEKPVVAEKPTGRDNLEQVAGYYKEFEPSEIKTWSNDELKKYVNTKLGMGSAAQDLAEVQPPKPGVDKAIDEFHVEQTSVDKDTIGRLLQAVQESKTKERSPEAMEAYLNLKGLGDKDVTLPADMIAETYGGITPHPDDGKFGWIDNIANRLPDAAELGSEISVPLSKFLANADTAALGDMKDFVRFGENGLSPIEADQWIDNFHERFAEEAEADDIKNLTEPEETRLPSRSGPVEWGPDNFLPMREEIEGKPGANVGRLLKLVSAKLYGEPTHMDKVTVKELLQNSYDSIKGALESGSIKAGNIIIEMDSGNRVIKMTDNGHGMVPDVLANEFLKVAATKKETTKASGGLGIAKGLLVFANKGLHVVTMRNGKVSELNSHGEELHMAAMDPENGPKIKIQVRAPTAEDKKFFPDGHGTHVEVTIPETFKDPQTGEEKDIEFHPWDEMHPSLVHSPLFGGNISVMWKDRSYRGSKALPIGRAWPIDKYTQFPPASFAWGNAQIYVSKAATHEAGKRWDDNLHILSNGVWQFSKTLKVNPLDVNSDIIPHDFYIDVHPKVDPDEPGYPFELNRQNLTADAQKSFAQVLNYLAKTYSMLDFASQMQSYGAIQYLRPGKGGVEVSPPQVLAPAVPLAKTSMTGLKESDKIEFKNDKLYVNGKSIPSLTDKDFAGSEIRFDQLMVDQKLIKPDQVMLHSSMETKVRGPDRGAFDVAVESYQKWANEHGFAGQFADEIDPGTMNDKERDELRQHLKNIRHAEMEDDVPGAEQWVPLDEAARQRFGPKFDEFMFEVGNTFIRLRDGIVAMMGKEYEPLLKEAIGISFDAKYRGVSIRVPFAGSFINPAVPQYTDEPIKAAVGTFGTMVHELAHHKVRSHNADFPAEMQKIQIWLDSAQIINNSNLSSNYINRQGMINALAKTFDKHWEIFQWLNQKVTSESQTRTRGRRIKGTDESAREGDTSGLANEQPDQGHGLEPAREETDSEPKRRAPRSSEIHSFTTDGKGILVDPTEQLAQILLHAEKKSLYLAPLFRDAKSAGMTQKQWTGYAKKLQEMDEKDYEKALAAAHKEVAETLTPAYKAEFNRIREEVESDFKSANDIAANNYFRMGKLPTGETQSPLKLDRAAVEYMGGKDALKDVTTAKGGVHPDDVAPTFGYQSGRELVQGLIDFDKARGRTTPEKYINQLIDEEANRRMAAQHGDLRERIAERAQEIALENHHVDILITELKQLAANSGQLPFTLDQIARRVQQLFDRVPFKEAKYQTYQKAVFKAGVLAEEHLLGGKIDKAFKAKQTQIYAVLAAKRARSFESYKKSQENTFKRVGNNVSISGVEQRYKDFASDILAGMGYSRPYNHPDHGPFSDFVTEHNGDIAAAYWITDPTQIRRLPNGAAIGYKDMNVEEFTALAKTIQSVLHAGRNEKKINTAYGKANIDNALLDMTNSMNRWPDKLQPKGVLGIRGGVSGAVRYVNAAHMLVERLFDYADKFDPRGAFSTYIDRPMRESYNEEIKLGEAAVKKLKYIREHYVDNSIYDIIDNKEIMDPLNGGAPMQLTRWNLRKIIAHAGSESGIEKVVNGHKITEDQLYALIVRNATKQDIQFANMMWELHNDLWTRAAIKYEKRTGVAPDPIEARPFDIKLKSGETVHATGGHEQVVYDRDLSAIAEDLSLKGDPFEPGYVTALPPNRYQVPRTKYYGPLDFTGSMESTRIAGMIHDIAFRDVVLDTRKLLMSKEATKEGGLREAIKKKFGLQYDQLLNGWLKDIANAHLVEDDFLRGGAHALAIIRQNVVGSLIFLKPTVAFKHGLTALGMSATQAGVKGMASGLYDVGGAGMVGAVKDMVKEQGMQADPSFAAAFQLISRPGKRGLKARAFIYNSSPMMRARRRQYRNSIRGAVDALGSAGWRRALVDTRQVSMSIGRMAVAMSDSMSADAEWLSVYNQHFRESGDHAESVYQADRAVTRAHGSNFVGDRSAIMRSRNEWIRNTALLFTYWNHFTVNMIQLGWDTGAFFKGRDEPYAKAGAIASRLALLFVLATITDMAAEAIFTHDKRPLWLQGLRAIGRQIGTGYYGLRDLTNVAMGYEPSAGAIGLMFKTLAQTVKDAAQGKTSRDWWRHLTAAFGMLFGVGGDQVGATATGVAHMMTGEETPENVPETVKQITTGHPRPAR